MNRAFHTAFLASAFLAQAAAAGTVERSLRPVARGVAAPDIEAIIQTHAVTRSARPVLRPLRPATPEQVIPASKQAGFDNWLKGFAARATRAGIRQSVVTRALATARYDPEVVRLDRSQSEFTKTLWDYLDSAASATRIKNGKAALRKYNSLLTKIEARYGVDKDVVVAIWGLESAYGTFRGSTPVISALATLAYDGRRGRFFEGQLLSALRILQSGDVRLDNFKGSWAGAMGHTQFIPSSYLSLAVDFNGDGKRDIWSDDPTDALASTAAYLARYGWVKGMPWGVEVRLPRGFDYALANRSIKKVPSAWAALGVKGMDGQAVKNYGSASVLVPAGAQGAAFLIFKNFDVIERYNTADAYVIGVGHLSDRITGGGPIKAGWPRGDRALTFAERKDMQRRLTAKGFNTHGVDGKIGPLTIDAVRRFQRSQGMIPDGYASLRILQKLQ